jgi:hypothetical protein
LNSIGFFEEDTHHKRFRYTSISGVPTSAKTFLSHGSKDYGDDLLLKMAHQLYLTKKELLRLIDGDMTREEYENILKIKGVL